MKNELAKLLASEGHEIVDFGNKVYDTNDDYPDFAIPLARAVARGDVERGSGVRQRRGRMCSRQQDWRRARRALSR
jgi:ribose 5-phosphate isomerase RpiB